MNFKGGLAMVIMLWLSVAFMAGLGWCLSKVDHLIKAEYVIAFFGTLVAFLTGIFAIK